MSSIQRTLSWIDLIHNQREERIIRTEYVIQIPQCIIERVDDWVSGDNLNMK
ncbi:MAG: hypothetical protein ABW185_29540 [Sedimenticola sp.]